MSTIKLISWNVNGIRAILKKDFHSSIEKLNPDIICIQETKAHPSQVDELLKDYVHHFWNSAEKKGYSGTAIFSKLKPITVTYGINLEKKDTEGRVITLELEKFYLVNVYTPNSQHGLKRLDYRQEWDKQFLKYIKDLEKKKPIIFCGDLNVAHKEIDLANPKSNRKNPGFTDEERQDFEDYIQNGFIDTFREFNSEPGQYSWWSYRFNARSKNIGWRIDYFLVSKTLRKNLLDAKIHQEILGSDHCPVEISLNFPR